MLQPLNPPLSGSNPQSFEGKAAPLISLQVAAKGVLNFGKVSKTSSGRKHDVSDLCSLGKLINKSSSLGTKKRSGCRFGSLLANLVSFGFSTRLEKIVFFIRIFLICHQLRGLICSKLI